MSTEIDFSDLLPEASNTTDMRVIDLYGKASPAILANILGIAVKTVHQYRQEGRLPTDPNSSYIQNIQAFCRWHKDKANKRNQPIMDRSMEAKIKLDLARAEVTLLEVRNRRSELVDKNLMLSIFEPAFTDVKAQLISLSRKHPEFQIEVDKILQSWYDFGTRLKSESLEQISAYVDEQMNAEYITEESE